MLKGGLLVILVETSAALESSPTEISRRGGEEFDTGTKAGMKVAVDIFPPAYKANPTHTNPTSFGT
jgi:hypothetical protein